VPARPERQCIGCGRRGPQSEFVRLCVEERGGSPGSSPAKVVTVGRGQKGRGAYLCRKQGCLDRALHRRAFQRAFRATVQVDEDQIREAVLTAEAGE
jgi:predicted RNA-binding protein YlxR (DUF448 family)